MHFKNKSKDFSIINRELIVDGTVSTGGQLIVKGTVKGTIFGENVIISEEGSVCADVKVVSMTIGGTFEGEIQASKELIVLSTGKCSGKVLCKDLVVEPGAILNARVSYFTTEDAGSENGDHE